MGILQMRNNANTKGLLDLINNLPEDLVMAEVGCYKGESTELFIKSNKIKTLFAIDIWVDDLGIYENLLHGHNFNAVENEFDNRVFNKNVTKLKMTFAEAFNQLPELDFIYIDANHNYDFVLNDINLAVMKIKKGGIISGHDYHTDTPDVIKAVNEVFGSPDIVYEDGSWLVKLK